MNKPILAAILAAILATLACGTYVTPTPTVSPAPTQAAQIATAPADTATPRPSPTAAPSDTVAEVVRVSVIVHTEADVKSGVAGYVYGGQLVTVLQCPKTDDGKEGDYCEISTNELTGWIWRGCLSDNPDGLGCESR